MAFDKNTKQANKNLVVLSMVSKATGDFASWTNLTETFTRRTMKCEPKDVTKAMLLEANIPAIFESKYLELHITDTTAEIEIVDPTNF